MSYSPLTDHGEATKQRLSQAYGLSDDAVSQMMSAVANGGGTQAQFNIPELGGMGQWSIGGMTMVGDMFNHGLQARVSGLCADISSAMNQGQFYKPAPQTSGNWQGQSQGQSQGQGGTSMSFGFSGGGWWPEELGQPASQGSQNDLSYAIFPQAQRLAVRAHGSVTVYDTGDHQIGGISQQQSGGASWTFTSQYGTVAVDQLRVVSGAGASQPSANFDPAPEPQFDPAPQFQPQSDPQFQPQSEPMAQPPQPTSGGSSDLSSDQVFAMLEKLGALREAGILTEEEFAAKKSELLSRL